MIPNISSTTSGGTPISKGETIRTLRTGHADDVVRRLPACKITLPTHLLHVLIQPQREGHRPVLGANPNASLHRRVRNPKLRASSTRRKQESERSPSPPPPKRGRASRRTVLSLTRKSARGKAAASDSKSPQQEPTSTTSLKKRKATEEVDESAPEDGGETSVGLVATVPLKIGPPARRNDS
jgi:hypothetical protein